MKAHLQQLKGMQESKQGMWKGNHSWIENTIPFFRKKWYYKAEGKVLDLGEEPPPYNIRWVPPRGFTLSRADIVPYRQHKTLVK